MKFYYEIMGEKNLRKEELNWTNWKVLGLFGWLWEVGGLLCNFFQSQKIFLTLLILYYIRHLEGESEIKFLHFFSHSQFFSPSLSPFSPSFLLTENSTALQFFLLLRFVSWVSTLILHVLMGRLLIWVIQILRNVLLSWIYIYLIWNIKDLRLSTSKCERVEKLRKQDTEHICCPNFLGLIQLCLHFSDIFPKY